MVSEDTRTILNSVSIACNISVFIFFLVVFVYKRKLVNVTSIRLTAGISFFLCISNIAKIINRNHRKELEDDIMACIFIGFIRIYSSLTFIFLIGFIAFNLHFTFIRGKKYKKSLELFYWSFSVFVPLVICLIILSLNKFGNGKVHKTCLIKDVFDEENFIILVSLYFIPTAIVSFYCLYVIVSSLFALNGKLKKLNRFKSGTQNREQKEIKYKMISVVLRV